MKCRRSRRSLKNRYALLLAALVNHVGAADDERIEIADTVGILVVVWQFVQHVAHGVQTRPLLAVRLDHRPWRIGGIGVEEHRLLGLGVVAPLVERSHVDR